MGIDYGLGRGLGYMEGCLSGEKSSWRVTTGLTQFNLTAWRMLHIFLYWATPNVDSFIQGRVIRYLFWVDIN